MGSVGTSADARRRGAISSSPERPRSVSPAVRHVPFARPARWRGARPGWHRGGF